MPSTVANGCPMDSFNKLKDVFDGPECDEPVKGMGLWVSFCLPSTVVNGCPIDSYNKLKDVFDGPACDEQVEAPKPEYMNVPHYKECLGTKDMGLWVSYCMPSTVANGCPMNSFNKLKDVFDGPACDDQLES